MKGFLQSPLRWYAALVLLVLAGDRIGGYWLQRQVMESQFRYARMYRNAAAAEVLLLGNSRGLCFYQPAIDSLCGKSNFNLSYNGLPADAAKCLLQDYLERYPLPKVILIDITMCDRENDALLSGFLCYAPWSNHLDTLLRHKMPKVWWGGEVSHLFRYNNEIFQRALFHRNTPDRAWLLDREISPSLAAQVAAHEYPLDVHPYLLRQLDEAVAYAQARGARVELVIGPYFPGFRVTNLDALKQEIENATGLRVHDYRSALHDISDFGDFMHPNVKGSTKYMALLKADGLLP